MFLYVNDKDLRYCKLDPYIDSDMEILLLNEEDMEWYEIVLEGMGYANICE